MLSSPAVRQLESAMSVKIHYAEHLYPTLHLLHPLVRIHVLDCKTAKPLPSTLGDARYSTIQPLLTEPFDLRVNKTMSPCWEEQVLIPEQYESIISNDTAMLFFEVSACALICWSAFEGTGLSSENLGENLMNS